MENDSFELSINVKVDKSLIETLVSEKIQQMLSVKVSTVMKAASSAIVAAKPITAVAAKSAEIVPKTAVADNSLKTITNELSKMVKKNIEKPKAVKKTAKQIKSDEKIAETKKEFAKKEVESAKNERAYDIKRKVAENKTVKDVKEGIEYIKTTLKLTDEFPEGDWILDKEQRCITRGFAAEKDGGYMLVSGKGFYLTYHYGKSVLYWIHIPNVVNGFTKKLPNIPKLCNIAKIE